MIFPILVIFAFSISSLADSTAIFSQGMNQYTIRLYQSSFGHHRLEVTTSNSTGKKGINTIAIPFPVYHFQIADIDNDGMNDILLGVIKKTHFDPVLRKRLFAYKIDQGYIRPLWLSSKVGLPLESFKAFHVGNKTIIRTIEHENKKCFYVGEYQWEGFGLSWIRYLGERIPYEKALQLYN